MTIAIVQHDKIGAPEYKVQSTVQKHEEEIGEGVLYRI